MGEEMVKWIKELLRKHWHSVAKADPWRHTQKKDADAPASGGDD